ncbi:hypothetical protein [Legionella gresilensis]|uniref:hypothetical protein n=1 Tax=Legionella gresilensis TaxID=91823 RepID=UPI00104168FC|nr:hypothetical protein [Legionella gresilensis]
MLSKGFFQSLTFNWDNHLSTRVNVMNVIQAYIPYRFNVFTKKNYIEEAQELVEYLETHSNLKDCEIYLGVQAVRQALKDEDGEFKRRLNFCVQKMEEGNILLKTLGSTGQAFKSLFSFNI